MATAEWVKRAEVRRRNNFRLKNQNHHDFRWDHLGHNVKEGTVVVNSDVVDPSSSDPEPVYGKQLTCVTCDSIKSAVE